MKNFSSIALALLVGVMMGMTLDSYYMANDEKFHDYWMERSKKN